MLTANAIKVLERRYLLRDDKGELAESPDELFHRVAKAVAGAEYKFQDDKDSVGKLAHRFYQAMANGMFMPNSPTLMNAGKIGGQLSACFVLPVPDTLEGIFETCKNAALIHKTGGGTGFSFSRLRPHNDRVASTAGVASGPVSFMTVYDAATEAIRQGGTRRGANMGILNIDHPDIELFISAKRDTNQLNNFNISVAVTEEFIEAVKEDKDFALVHPTSRAKVKTVRACDLFAKIVENAHATGEPGLIFLDRINASDPLFQAYGTDGKIIAGTEDIEATNPCGEQPLGPGDACNLGSINLAAFINADGSNFDWDALKDMVHLGVRFLDNIIESNHYPLPFIADAALANRRVGLGVMGWADALIALNICYDSNEALEKAEEVMRFIQVESHAASQQLAKERGNFPNWPFSSWGKDGVAMRNATVTTIAPTGTISIIAGTSSGIEPIFAVSYIRRVLAGTELIEVNPAFEKLAHQGGFYSEELMRKIAEDGGIQHIDGISDEVKRLFKCAHDIDYTWHVRMQAAFQKYTDCAVSKTINLARDATVEDVRAAYWLASELGLKGITVYRDTSRESQVLNIARTDPRKKAKSAGLAGTVISPQVAPTINSNAIALTYKERASNSKGAHSLHRAGEDKFSRVLPESQKAVALRSSAFHFNQCTECGSHSSSLMHAEACWLCHSCGYTKC